MRNARRRDRDCHLAGNETKAMSYVTAHQIHVGQWRFFPEFAQNMHNGNWARFYRTADEGWAVRCVNCPAEWMLTQLAS